jgi:hypothetical protein
METNLYSAIENGRLSLVLALAAGGPLESMETPGLEDKAPPSTPTKPSPACMRDAVAA